MAARSSSPASSHAHQRARQGRHRVVVDGEGQPGRGGGRHGGGERGRHLGQARVGGRHRQRPRGGRLGGHHPEGLRVGARHDLRLGGGQQGRELVVLEPPGQDHAVREDARGLHVAVARVAGEPVEERGQVAQRAGRAALARPPVLGDGPRGAQVAPGQGRHELLERRPPRPEPDDDQARVGHRGEHERPGRRQEVRALGDDELAHERDEAVAIEVQAAERRAGRRGVAREARAGRGVLGRRGAQPRGQRGQVRSGLGARPGAELLDVDPGRSQAGARRQRRVVHRRPEALGRVPRPDEHGPGASEPLARGREEALGLGLDRVLERAAVDLDRVGDIGRERPGQDERRHHEVPGERGVGPRPGHDVAHGGDVRVDVGRDLRVGAVGEPPRLDALVAVQDIGGQQPAELGPPRGHPHRLPHHADDRTPVRPAPHRVDERQRLGPGLLGDEVDHVPLSRERRDEAGGVDVRPRPVQEVAVGDEQPHGRRRTLAAASVAAAGGVPRAPKGARDPPRGAPLVARGRRSSPRRTARTHRPSPRLAVLRLSCQVPDRWRGPEHEGPAERSWRGDA